MSRLHAGAGAPARKVVVIALHCSGSSGRQWDKLASTLGDRCRLIAPDLIGGSAVAQPRAGDRFRLADETAPILEVIDAQEEPVHLVGHSYGGGVALHVACERPARIASLSLYEPTAFYLLRRAGADARPEWEEIRSLAAGVSRDVAAGDYSAAACRFVDYWNGAGAWAAMKMESKAELMEYMAKTPLAFDALFEDPARPFAFGRLTCPLLLMRGERGPAPTARITRELHRAMPDATFEEIGVAGHMGPISHAERVNGLIAAHVLGAGLDHLPCRADADAGRRATRNSISHGSFYSLGGRRP